MLMPGERSRRYDIDHRRLTASLVRRVALTVVAAMLLVAAEVLAALGAATPHTRHLTLRTTVATHSAPVPYGGEPRLPRDTTAPRAPWTAAVRFVRDYSSWSRGRLAAILAEDATSRVIRLLERTGRDGTAATAGGGGSVRIAPAGAKRYVVTSAIGNFLIGRRGSRWLVVSLPGD
jgi:hypothetical protein